MILSPGPSNNSQLNNLTFLGPRFFMCQMKILVILKGNEVLVEFPNLLHCSKPPEKWALSNCTQSCVLYDELRQL